MFDRSRRRLAVWFTLSMGSILILFAFTLYQRQMVEQRREFDAEIYSLAEKLANKTKYRNRGKKIEIASIAISLAHRAQASESPIVCSRWYDARKNLIRSVGECPQQNSVSSTWQTVKHGHNSYTELRILTLPLIEGKYTAGYLQVTASLETINDFQRRSLLFLAVGMPITLSITGIVGWFLAGYAMRPVKRSYEQLQRFTADASHELRAPVAAILSNAQVGLLAPTNDTTQPRQRLENIVTQSKYMSDLITNLLFLARHQGKLNPQDVDKTNVVKLLNSLGDRYQTLATEKGLKFELDIPIASKEIICSTMRLNILIAVRSN